MECQKCNHQNRAGARFCQVCGAPLEESQQPSSAPTTPASEPSAQISPKKGDTAPLPSRIEGFHPLPLGALLHQDRYVVQEVRSTGPEENFYLVESVEARRYCPNCKPQAGINSPQERFCNSCGADLSQVEAVRLRYQMQEHTNEDAFNVEEQLMRSNFQHPALYLPYDVFGAVPYDDRLRRYRVMDEFPLTPAGQLKLPQELNTVLVWGQSLAEGMAYLHQHQVVLGAVTLNRIGVRNHHAGWRDLNQAQIIPPESRGRVEKGLFKEVQDLARLLLYMSTGQRQLPVPDLPEPFAQLMEQVLGSESRTMSAANFATALSEALHTLSHPENVTWTAGSLSDVGQVRSLNEDSTLTVEMVPTLRSQRYPVGVYLVADGMGGHEAGDVASQLVVQTIARRAANEILSPAADGPSLPNVGEWLSDVVTAANQVVYDERKKAGSDMGTTLVMALMVGDQATIANVGDSRGYLLTDTEIRQLTTDHSLVERLVAAGQIKPEEAATHPQKNVIYRVIGDRPKLEVDLFQQRLEAGQALLLCSDGLSGMITDQQIWQIWKSSVSPQEACRRMVEAANQAGGEDNVSVVVLQLAT